MSRSAIAVQEIAGSSGAVLTTATPDSGNGNNFPNDGKTRLIVRNGDASAKTVTVRAVPCSHGRSVDLVVSVTAGAMALFGPFEPSIWNQSDGTVNVDWSASTSVTVAAVRHV